MNTIKKGITMLALATLSHTIFAAGIDDRMGEVGKRIDRIYITTPNGTCGAYTASARPTLNSCGECCGSNWNIGASLLYWQGGTCGTDYAYGKQNPVLEFPSKGSVKDVHSKWNFGFKVSLGYNINHDGWESNLCYSDFSGTGSDKIASGCNDNVIPLLGAYNITTPADGAVFFFCSEAKSQSEVHFRTLYWDLARDFFVSDCLSIRPFTALEAAWITTRQSTRYTGGDPIGTTFGIGDDLVHIKENCTFKGLGPVMGFGANWYIGRGVSLFNEFTIGMLYGKFQISHSERYSPNDLSRIKLKNDCHKFCPMAKYMLGLARKCYFNDDQNHLLVRIGFESQYWWRVNQVVRVIDVPSAAEISPLVKYLRQGLDFSIMGLTVDVRLDF